MQTTLIIIPFRRNTAAVEYLNKLFKNASVQWVFIEHGTNEIAFALVLWMEHLLLTTYLILHKIRNEPISCFLLSHKIPIGCTREFSFLWGDSSCSLDLFYFDIKTELCHPDFIILGIISSSNLYKLSTIFIFFINVEVCEHDLGLLHFHVKTIQRIWIFITLFKT